MVLFGAGHSYPLRELVQSTHSYRLVEPNTYRLKQCPSTDNHEHRRGPQDKMPPEGAPRWGFGSLPGTSPLKSGIERNVLKAFAPLGCDLEMPRQRTCDNMSLSAEKRCHGDIQPGI